jgi:uncharacterized membrane protein YgcG
LFILEKGIVWKTLCIVLTKHYHFTNKHMYSVYTKRFTQTVLMMAAVGFIYFATALFVGVESASAQTPATSTVEVNIYKKIDGDKNGYDESDFTFRITGNGIDEVLSYNSIIALPVGTYTVEELVPDGFIKEDWRVGWYGIGCEESESNPYFGVIEITEQDIGHFLTPKPCEVNNQYRPGGDNSGGGGGDEDPILGCTDPDADNFDPDATEDDGSCIVDNGNGGGGDNGNGGGSDTPPVCVFTASDTTVSASTTVQLSWNMFGAQSVFVDNGVGTTTSTGTVDVLITQGITYTLTAEYDENTLHCPLSIAISTPSSGGNGGGGDDGGGRSTGGGGERIELTERTPSSESEGSPEPEILGEQVSAVPMGAPYTGAGGTSRDATIPFAFALLLMGAAFVTLRQTRVHG